MGEWERTVRADLAHIFYENPDPRVLGRQLVEYLMGRGLSPDRICAILENDLMVEAPEKLVEFWVRRGLA